MEGIPCEMKCRAEGPYPEVRARGKNRRYGQAILSNVGGSVSEMGAVAQYIYARFTQAGRPEVAECLGQIAVVEMHHLSIFSTLASQLGEDPRLWTPFRGGRKYWTPEYLRYPQRLDQVLRYGIEEERTAIRKYTQQTLWIKDENVLANLQRIIEDEKVHIEVLTSLLESYCNQG